MTAAPAPVGSRAAVQVIVSAILALTLPSLAGCSPQEKSSPNVPGVSSSQQKGPILLSIRGYNYTNRYIASFSVNGQGAGNLFVSTATSGGGSRACCVSYLPGSKIQKIKVRWQSDACYFRGRPSMSGTPHDELHMIFKEVEVEVRGKVPNDSQVLEVHFYPDGNVEAEIGEEITRPRLKLSSDREDKSDFPRCPNDQKPE